MEDWRKRISFDRAVQAGKPVIVGTRVTVELILDRLADGWTVDEVLAAYPSLVRDDAYSALACAAGVIGSRPDIVAAILSAK